MKAKFPEHTQECLLYEFNPQIKLESHLSSLNEIVFEQARQVKHQLRNKSSTTTNSQHLNEHPYASYTRVFQQKRQNIEKKERKSRFFEEQKCIKSKKKGLKNNKTIENQINCDLEQSILSPVNKRSIFQKITIHSLRANRQHLEEQINKIQRYYSYTRSKIDRMKRSQQKKAKQTEKFKKLIKQKRNSTKEVTESKQYHEEAYRRRNGILKSQVLDHRLQKKQQILKNREQKREKGDIGRLHSEQLQKMQQQQDETIKHQKNMSFMKQKINELNLKKQLARINQEKRKQAQFRFKQKWLMELQAVQRSKGEMIDKKKQVSRKIRQALRSYSMAITQQ